MNGVERRPVDRLSDYAYQVLLRAAQSGAHVLFMPERGSWYYGLGLSISQDRIKETAVDALMREGFLRRAAGAQLPTYVVTQKGLKAVSERAGELSLLGVPAHDATPYV
jgi:hypothetical protein